MNEDINIGALSEALNGKADIDFNNAVPDSAYIQKAISWQIPDYASGTTVSFTQGQIWTVPYDCELYFVQSVNGGGAVKLRLNNASGPIVFYTGSSTVNAVCSDRAKFKKGTKLYCERYVPGGGWYANCAFPLTTEEGEE